MHSVTAMFCPELTKIYNTQEILDKGISGARDELTFNPEFKGATISSKSRETSHLDAMILVMQEDVFEAEFWRIESDPVNKYETLYSLLFSLRA